MSEKKVPKIRFPGFEGEWEERKLADWGSFYYGRSCPKWSVTEDAKIPCIRYGELYTKFGSKIDKVYSYTNLSPDNLRFSKGTEVLIPRVGEDPMDYNHCTWLSLKDVAIGEMISVFNTDQDPLFSAIMFNATLQKEFAIRVEGGSVTNLYFEKIKNIDVSYPTLSEQKQIASFIESVDRYIVKLQNEEAKWKELKKGMLQKMFPKEGESVPEIRFPGFTDSWEQRKIIDVCDYVDYRGKTPTKTNEGIFLITAKNVKDGYIDYETSKEFIPEDEYEEVMHRGKPRIGDVLFTTEAPCGNVAQVNREDIALAQRIIKYRGHDGVIDNTYLKHYLLSPSFQTVLGAKSTGGTVQGIKGSELHQQVIICPKYEEQKKIGAFIDDIDNLITLHQRECEKWQSLKKALLQQMFV